MVTAILVPFVVDWLYKREQKKGLINMNVPRADQIEADEPAL